MSKVLSRCPVCEEAVHVSEVRCDRCKTTVHGRFDSCRFCRLTPEHLAFIELFLRSEGNLSKVEKELNLSYPTVRNRLQASLAALRLSSETDRSSAPPGAVPTPYDDAEETEFERTAPDPERRRTVLDALARGEMSAEEAAEALRDLF